jgi:hypothetical protein
VETKPPPFSLAGTHGFEFVTLDDLWRSSSIILRKEHLDNIGKS